MRNIKSRNKKTPHFGQIITTKRNIQNELFNHDLYVTTQILVCIRLGPDHPDYVTHLVAVSMRLWFIEKLVYEGKDQNWKPSSDYYMKNLFEGFGETPEECQHLLNTDDWSVDINEARRIHSCLWKIAKLVSPMVACQKEMLSPAELAYSIDYVIRNNATLDDPVFDEEIPCIPWPKNYPGFEITGLPDSIERFFNPVIGQKNWDLEKACCFTGHRPEKCKGSEEAIRKALHEEIMKAIENGYNTFISGMAPGVDLWAALEVMYIQWENYPDINLICAVPYHGFEESDQEYFETMAVIEQFSSEIRYVCKEYSEDCFNARDRWLANNASLVIAVFNGTPGGTAYTIEYAESLGRKIVRIDDSTLK